MKTTTGWLATAAVVLALTVRLSAIGSVYLVDGANVSPPGTLASFSDGWIIDQLNTGGADLWVSTAQSTNALVANLTVEASALIAWNSANRLLLSADNRMDLNGGITNAGIGGVVLSADAGLAFGTGASLGLAGDLQLAGSTIAFGSNDFTARTTTVLRGLLSGTGTLTGDLIIDSPAGFDQGDARGLLSVDGSLASSGNLVFRIGGRNAGDFDALRIRGDVTFSRGLLRFDFVDGFAASAGDSWEFLHADSVIGWDSVGLAFDGLGSGLGWEFEAIEDGGRRLRITEIEGGIDGVVPEPAAYGITAAAALFIVGISRRLRRHR